MARGHPVPEARQPAPEDAAEPKCAKKAQGVAPGSPERVRPAAGPASGDEHEGKRARVAQVSGLDVDNLDEPPWEAWDGIPDDVEDGPEAFFSPDQEDELDRAATEEALDKMIHHGVGKDIRPDDARGMKHLSTRWEKQWRWKPSTGEWARKVRFVCREYRWQEWRDDLFTPGSTPLANRVIGDLALKKGYATMTLDTTDAF